MHPRELLSTVLDPGPVPGRACTPCVTKEQIQHQIWKGKKEKQGGRPKSAIWRAQQVTGWRGSDATSTRKELSLAVSLGFIGKIIKTFSFLNIWQRLLHKPRRHFCPYRFRQRKESLKGKTKQNPIDFLHGYWKGSWKNLSCEREGHQEVLPGPRQVTQLFVSFTDISVSEQYEITNLPTCCRSQSEEFHHA